MLIAWCDYLHLAGEDAVRWRCLWTIKERTLSFSSPFLNQEMDVVTLILNLSGDWTSPHNYRYTWNYSYNGSARTITYTSSSFLKTVFVVKIHRFILNNKIYFYLWLIGMQFFFSSWARISYRKKVMKLWREKILRVWCNALPKKRTANTFFYFIKGKRTMKKVVKINEYLLMISLKSLLKTL